MPDESIEVQILVETSEALKNAEEIRERLDDLKKEMFDLSSQGKQALKDIAAGMIEAKKAAQELEKVELANLTGDVDKDFIKQQREELTQYSKDVRTALAEALKEETEYFKQQEQLAKQASTTRKAEFKGATDDEKAQAKEAARAQSEYAKVTQQGFGVMSAAAQDYGNRIQKIKDIIVNTAQSTGQSWDQVAQRMQKFGVSTNDINQALKELNSQTKATTQSTKIFGIEVGKLGDIGKFVFGSILGISAVTAIREIIGLFKEAAGEAIEFSAELFKLGASTRALQRSGLDITIGDVSEKITELRQEFSVFSKKDIVSGLAQIQLYTRQLGFTVEQQDQMIDSVATLSLVMGKDFGETARSVALFLSSGYGEALQRAGIVDANRAAVAQELLALGFNKSFNEATQQERALAGLNIIMRGVADLSDETAAAQETLAGKVNQLDAAWQDLLLTLGQELPIGGAIEQITSGIREVTRLLEELKIGWAIAFAPFFLQAELALAVWKKLYETITGDKLEITLDFPEFFKKDDDELKSRMRDLGEDAIKSFKQGMEDELDLTDIIEEIINEMDKVGDALQNRIDAIGRDVANDIDKIGRDATNDINDIGRKLFEKLTDIIVEQEQKIADAIRRAAIQRAQTLRQAAIREAEINRKYRERELKAERDYQESLRRLREDFLFDLEDALRERDALQVLRLTKRYNLEQDRLKRQRDEEREDLRRQRREELEQLRIQTQERLRVLQEELQARIEALKIAAQRERDQAILDAQRKIEEERIQEQQRKDERRIREQEQIDEEKERAKERLAAYAEEIAEREGLTQEALDTLIKALEDNYGEGGLVQGVISGLEQALLEANAAVAASVEEMARRIKQAIAQIHALNYPQSSSSNSNTQTSSPGGGGYQEGGTLIANKPTTALFGEGGPELVQFTPLNRIGRNENKIFNSGKLPSLGGNGKLALEIMLSKGLEAQIIESALDEVADVIVNVQRKR